jgi:hypothetical protein
MIHESHRSSAQKSGILGRPAAEEWLGDVFAWLEAVPHYPVAFVSWGYALKMGSPAAKIDPFCWRMMRPVVDLGVVIPLARFPLNTLT